MTHKLRATIIIIKLLLLILFLANATAQSQAQDSTAVDSSWTKEVSFGLNLNQAAFSDNWQGGGTDNIAFGLITKGSANYSEGSHTWDNQTLLEFGQQKSTSASDEWRKTVDQIFIDSKYGYVISKSWNAFASLNFRSQFAPGYEYQVDDEGNTSQKRISEFMSPGYLTEAFGIEYKPSKEFFARFGTGTLRQTFVLDTSLYLNTPNQNNYGVERGETWRNELAFQLDMGYNASLMENINLQSRYTMFANYETIDEISTIDHRLDAIITMKVNDFINVTLSGTFLYDEDQVARRQWSQATNIGFLLTY